MRCSVVWSIFKRNLTGYFAGALGSLIILVFVTADAALTFDAEFFANNLATLDQLTAVFPQLLLFLVPAITMGVWAEERRQGTDELLFTLPANDVEILLGKYFAVLAVYSIALLFTLPKLLVLEYYANPDWNLLLTTYLGYWLAGAALLSAGMFASSLIANTTAAFVLGVAICAIPVFIGRVSFGNEVVESLALGEHLNDFGIGLIPLGGLLYFVSFALVMLYLNYILITRRHWAADRSAGMGLHYVLRVVCLLVVLIAVNYAIRRGSTVTNLRLDATAEGLHTLSGETRSIVRSIPEDSGVEIQVFTSNELPRDYVDHGRALDRLLNQYRRLGADRILVRKVEGVEPHTPAADEAEAFGITPRTIDHEDQTGQRSDDVFLGAVVTGPRDEVVIPFFEPTMSVEYELTRAIAKVTEREKLRVGLLSTPTADLLDSQQGGESRFVTLLRRHYDVDTVRPSSPIPLDRETEFEIWTDADEAAWREWSKAEAEKRKAAEEAAAAKSNEDPTAPDSGDEEAENPESNEEEPSSEDFPSDDAPDDVSSEQPSDDDSEENDPGGEGETEESEKPREKPTRSSRRLDEDPAESLDKETIPEAFRKSLAWRGIHLSAAATVAVDEAGKHWSINDVNPEKTYRVAKDGHEIVVKANQYDVVVAVMPSGLTESELDHFVDYVKAGRSVLVFDDPLPLHVKLFPGLELSPVRPRLPEPSMRPGMPAPPSAPKADDGRATALLQSLGLVWQYDEAVWDAYDPHPNFRELPAPRDYVIPLLYVGRENGTDQALSKESPVTAGLDELQFIYPGRINPSSQSRFEFRPLVRVGPESGTYGWNDIVITSRGRPGPANLDGSRREIVRMQDNPEQGIVTSGPEGERVRRFCLAAHVTAPDQVIVEIDLPAAETTSVFENLSGRFEEVLAKIEGITDVESKLEQRGKRSYCVTKLVVAGAVLRSKASGGEPVAEDESEKTNGAADTDGAGSTALDALVAKVRKAVTESATELVRGSGRPRVESETRRNAIFVADVDMIGNIPLQIFEESLDPRIDFRIDNSRFLMNAIEVLAGRTGLVGLQSQKARHRILTEVERRKQRLDAETTKAIRQAREEEKSNREEFQSRLEKQQAKLADNEGLSFFERIQEGTLAVRAAQSSYERQLEKIERETESKIDRLNARNRREVRALQNDIRTRAIVYPLLPAILFAIGLLSWRLASERMHVDPARSRRA